MRAQAGNAGSNDMGLTDTSAQANGYQCGAARAAFPGDADALEGEGSGSNPTGAALASVMITGSACRDVRGCWQGGRRAGCCGECSRLLPARHVLAGKCAAR